MTRQQKTNEVQPTSPASEKPTLTESIGLVKWLLEWAAKSWQNLVTFVVLAAVLGIGFWAYTMPDSVRKMAIKSITEPTVEVQKIEKVKTELLEQTGAIGYSIDLVDFEQNTRRNAVFNVSGKDAASMVSQIEPVFPRDSPTVSNNIVKLIHGQVVCINPDTTNTPEVKLAAYSKLGITEVCSVGLPPGYTSYFKGILAVYFDEKISSQQMNTVELVLSRMSKQIMSDSN